jgi:RNA polymerase sigma-70 factor (ECF subfamily)
MPVAATNQLLDIESHEWLRDLRAGGATADAALARLHALLLHAATFEVARRRTASPHLRADIDEIALAAANDALISVRARLDDFRGDSRFTTWAYKFAVFEAAVKLRRRAWQGRELPTAPTGMNHFTDVRLDPTTALEQRELLDAVREGMERLTPYQHDVLVALALNDVPIDVLAERHDTTRDTLYKTLHDARVKLRRYVASAGRAVKEPETPRRPHSPSSSDLRD